MELVLDPEAYKPRDNETQECSGTITWTISCRILLWNWRQASWEAVLAVQVRGTWTKTGSTGTCGASLSAKCNDSWYSIECSMRENTSDMSDWVSAVIISHTEEWFKRWSWSDRFVSYKIPNQQEHQKWREESQHEVVLPALHTLNWHTEEEDPTMENKRDGWTLVPFVSTMVFQKERLPYWNVVFLTQ